LTDAPAASLCEAFQRTADRHPDAVALRTPGGGEQLTWADYAGRVERIAGGLEALGVQRGEAVGLMMVNRPEFHLVDTAALHLGASPFSIYNTSAPEQIEYLFTNAANRVVVCDAAFLPRVLASRDGTPLEHVVCVDGPADGAISLQELEAGRRPAFDADAFEARWREVDGSDVATLIYTSGTTGPPKGVELTHANLLAELRLVLPAVGSPGPDDRAVSYLPAAHVADRLLSHYAAMVTGLQVTPLADARELSQAIVEVRPTFFGGVPRVWEKLMAGLQSVEGRPRRRALVHVRRRADSDGGARLLPRPRAAGAGGVGHVRAQRRRHHQPGGRDPRGYGGQAAAGGRGEARGGRGAPLPGPDRDARLPQPARQDGRDDRP
jgi:long-chain acyl-CoA synthetase